MLTTHTNVAATAVNTIGWLEEANRTIAVPVFQRHYRWSLEACRRLLDDILAASDTQHGESHFIGSILSTTTTSDGIEELTLIDGQQRVSTLTLLIAALHRSLKTSDSELAGRLGKMLLHPTIPGRTRLRPHERRAGVLEGIVFGRTLSQEEREASHFDENYFFFLETVQEDPHKVWRGLEKLEHVAITLKEHAHPQQVFESLNSTGARLSNSELIDNYVLMGLSHAQQLEIENTFWVSIEDNTGEAIDAFLRAYLVLRTGRDTEFQGEHGTYDAFKREFPNLKFGDLQDRLGPEWKAYSEVYRVLLDPAQVGDDDIARQLRYVNTFGAAMYPLLLGIYRDYLDGRTGKDKLIETVERLQSLFIRKMVVGETRDHLVAQLCRKWRKSGYPITTLCVGPQQMNEFVAP